MKNTWTLTALAVGLTLISLTPPAHADEWDKKTIITTTEALQLPNVVLQPGTYVMKLLNSQSDRHIVQVFDQDQKQLITTILAIPNYRIQPTGKTQFSYWEVPAGQPKALRAWFYPGDNFGQEFAYPQNLSTQIAAYTKTSVPTTDSNSTTAKVESTDQNGLRRALEQRSNTPPPAPTPAPPPVAAQLEPRPQPAQVAQATAPPAPEPAAIPTELPKTASPLPLVGLIGLASIAAFGLTRLARN
jgi:hypothetical protein